MRAGYFPVPSAFLFAVKKFQPDHTQRLPRDSDEPLDRFLSRSAPLSTTNRPLLVELPPGHRFDAERVEAFFATLRAASMAVSASATTPRELVYRRGPARACGSTGARAAADPGTRAGGCTAGWQTMGEVLSAITLE